MSRIYARLKLMTLSHFVCLYRLCSGHKVKTEKSHLMSLFATRTGCARKQTRVPSWVGIILLWAPSIQLKFELRWPTLPVAAGVQLGLRWPKNSDVSGNGSLRITMIRWLDAINNTQVIVNSSTGPVTTVFEESHARSLGKFDCQKARDNSQSSHAMGSDRDRTRA